MNKLTYRPEIDGLRAIAVLSVVAYHLGITGFFGGFIGVDIFFVISGYLITRIIATQLEAGTFCFTDFYNRRIKRIYPMFILVVGLSSFLGIVIFDGLHFDRLRQGVEFSAIFATNFYFAKGGGYFDLENDSHPLLHLWSLSVEEQYYLFFPLLVYFLYRFARRATPWILGGLALISLVLCWLPQEYYTHFIHRYYLSHLRFFELLIGACLVYVPRYDTVIHHRWAPWVSVLCLLGLWICNIAYYPDMAFVPGLALLLPVLFTASIIYLAQAQQGVVYRFLSHTIMVRIGLLSYSLYLWHWLLVAFGHYVFGHGPFHPINTILIIVASFILSCLSYYLVEQPVRRLKCSFKVSLICIYILPSIFIIGINFFANLYLKARDEQIVRDLTPVFTYHEPPFQVLSLGDSHNAHLQMFMRYVGEREGWHAHIEHVHSCPFPVDIDGQPKTDPACQRILNLVKQYPVVYLSFFHSMYAGKAIPRADRLKWVVPDYQAKFMAWVKYLSKTHQVFVFSDTHAISQSALLHWRLSKLGMGKYLAPIQIVGETTQMNQALQAWIADTPNVHWVDIEAHLPQEAFFEGKPLFQDNDHFTPWGSYILGKRFYQSGSRILEIPQ